MTAKVETYCDDLSNRLNRIEGRLESVKKSVQTFAGQRWMVRIVVAIVVGLTPAVCFGQPGKGLPPHGPGGGHYGCFGYCPGPVPPPHWGCYGYCPGPLPPAPPPHWGCYGYCPRPLPYPQYGCFGYCPVYPP